MSVKWRKNRRTQGGTSRKEAVNKSRCAGGPMSLCAGAYEFGNMTKAFCLWPTEALSHCDTTNFSSFLQGVQHRLDRPIP